MRDWWRDLWTGRKAGRRPSACTLESEGVMILACIYFSSYDVLLLLCVSVLPWAKQKSVLAGRNSICPAREDVDGGCDPEAQKSESRQSLRSTLRGLRPGRRDPGSPAPHTRPVVARSELPCCCHAQLMPREVLAQMCEECDVEMFMVLPRRNSQCLSQETHTVVAERLAWLRYLDKRVSQSSGAEWSTEKVECFPRPCQLSGLFKSLLPHRCRPKFPLAGLHSVPFHG